MNRGPLTHLYALSKKYPNAWQVAEYCFLNREKAAQDRLQVAADHHGEGKDS